MHVHQWNGISGALRDMPEVGVKRCALCGLVNHNRDLREIVSYESGTMHDWAKGWGDQLGGPQADSSRRIEAFNSILPQEGGHFLDYGCGDGSLVLEMSGRNHISFGLDPDTEASQGARVAGATIFNSLEEIPESLKFDLISLIHVVEHLYEIVRELYTIRNLLKPGGTLVIETPNANDALLTLFQSLPFQKFTYWSHHPNLCSNKFLSEALQDAGFRVTENTQIQRYGLANHLHWLALGLPGGHEAWAQLSDALLDKQYESRLVDQGIADTIWIEAQL